MNRKLASVAVETKALLSRSGVLAMLAATSGCTLAVDSPSEEIDQVERPIIGGQNANTNEWPWQVLIREDGEMHCGGVILNRDWVLTAAHCVWGLLSPLDPATLTVVAGDHLLGSSSGNEQTRTIAQVVVHPNWGTAFRQPDGNIVLGNLFNDVALIRLSQSLNLNQRVQTIPLSNQFIPTGTEVFATGWGLTDAENEDPPNTLQELQTAVVDPAQCSNVMRANIEEDIGTDSRIEVDGAHICMGTPSPTVRTACGGDSGGPLVTRDAAGNWSLVGVTSWGSLDCHLYGVYGHVRAQKPWIESVINGGTVQSCSGRTIPGRGPWRPSATLGFTRILPNTSACATPEAHDGRSDLSTLYFTTLGGTSGHWEALGTNTLVPDETNNFNVHLEHPTAVTPATAETRKYHINWEETDDFLSRADLCTGRTSDLGWQQYNENGIYMDVYMGQCPFAPSGAAIFTSLRANSHMTDLKGVTSIYPLSDGFRVYVRKPGITPAFAAQLDFNLQWQAVPYNTNNSDACVGRTSPTNTAWVADGGSLRVDIDTSVCGETRTPIYLTSLGGKSRHWATSGVTSVYSPTATGFRVYVKTTETVATAKAQQWHVNWKVSRN
jgi:secreted trypsin-like serine protease